MNLTNLFSKINKNIVIVVLIVLIATFSIISIKLYTLLYTIRPLEPINPPDYHFYLVAQNSVDPFWKEVYRGALDSANENNIALEFKAPRFNDSNEQINYMEIAIISDVDGIATYVPYDERFVDLIDKADSKGIPVVTVDNDAYKSNRKSFIGTNSFVLGEEAGKIMVDATGEKANIAVIMSNDVQKDTAYHNLKLNGFLNVIKNYPEMQITDISISKMGIMSAEDITQSILNSDKTIDAIYCMDSVDTVGAAQVVVDLNKVGNIKIVGYGDAPEIIRYIEKSIIYGTVMSDPYKMGYESIEALLEIKKSGNSSTFIDTGVKTITKESINKYKEALEKLEQ